MTERFIIIDGHAILHRAFHALPPLTNSRGELVNAVFGFTSMLLRVIHDLRPAYLAVTFDRPKPTFRKKIYKDYQAKRPKMDEDLVPQIELVHKVVREMGIPIFEMDGYEADDVIGTIAKQALQLSVSSQSVNRSVSLKDRKTEKLKNLGLKTNNREPITEVIIVTGDRDILQLVNDKVKVYMPVKGLSESKLYDEKAVEEKFGIAPSQIIDYKALVGDPSDNYPGVAGIGPKTAVSLLSRFKTLEQIYKNIKKVENEGLREKLIKEEEAAEMAKQLATITTDVPIEVNLEKCRLPVLDRPNVNHLFAELEFRSLIPRLSNKATKLSSYQAIKQKEKKEQLSLLE